MTHGVMSVTLAGPTGIEPVTPGFLCRWLKSPVL